MPIKTSFTFGHHIAAASLPPADPLGPLRGFVGNRPADQPRTWQGSGFNMIWRPNFGGQSGPQDFFLQLNMTTETLSFTDITGNGIANRGLLQRDVTLGGLAYVQTIKDSFDNTGQHFEPGVWANIPNTTDPLEPATVTRMGSIPHGTTVNLQGRGVVAGAPVFPPVSITPFVQGQQGNLVHFPEEQLANASQSRTPLNRVQTLTQTQLDNPNLFLSQVAGAQQILASTVLTLTSEVSAATIPNAGGGSSDIAFLVGAAPSNRPNARVSRIDTTFWIERVRGTNGQPDFDQLQYTQRVLLDFNGLSWPHVTVATLTSP